MSKKNYVSVVYDRKKMLKKRGVGAVEIRIYLARDQRKYYSVGMASPQEWKGIAQRADISAKMENFQRIVEAMEILGEDMTIENFEAHINSEEKKKKENEVKGLMFNGVDQTTSFPDYMQSCVEKENISDTTRRQKKCAVDALRSFGKLNTFADLTTANFIAFDKWLHNGKRTDVAVFNYHKRIRTYTRQLRIADMIPYDPYDKVKFSRGKCKERRPLTEVQLKELREVKLEGKMEKARDLFVFAAYTGMSFCDVMLFDFNKMAEEYDGQYYIESSRQKTSSRFFTPILAPAMDVLRKYNYQLPRISNQKANDYLHLVEEKLGLNKSLTFHVARHTFATLMLAHDVPIENVARMLGHQDIKTTQIYTKILKSTIERHTAAVAKTLL